MHQHPSSAAAMGAEALWDLLSEDMAAAAAAAAEHGLPPGFRFHPTDEELVTFYLAPKAFNNNNSSSNNNDDSGSSAAVDFIVEVDLNRCEPWELPESARMGGEREWYFFSLRDRKYPTGLRTNRATGAGYWKATGKDKEVLCAATGALIGMKKTLVFYEGRAPRGHKSKWVLHEYRLDGDFASDRRSCKEEWVVCRIFHKAVDQYSSKMMEMRMMSPYHHCYHPMSHRHHPSFVFQEAPPVPFPSPSDQLPVVPFLHHHHHDLIPNQQQPSPLITQNHHQLLQAADKNSSSNNGGFPVPAAACIQDHQPNNNTAPYFPFPSFASASGFTVAVNGAGKAGPLPGVNGAGPQELPPTWPLDNFLQHGTYLYEAGPPAGAPRDA